MKPVRFDYERPATLDAALDALARDDRVARVIAGAQSLGPMLNLRLVQPELLVDVTAIPELLGIQQEGQRLVIGACVTHAQLEDYRCSDPTQSVLASIAGGIAYRAVRNRGTIGGSLAHADPSADWVACAAALGVEVMLASKSGRRALGVREFLLGAFETALEAGEVLVEIHMPRLSSQARWGYYKFCRKSGEFAHASAAVLIDPPRGIRRCVIGATFGCPVVIDDPRFIEDRERDARVADVLSSTALRDDPLAVHTHAVVLRRAIARAVA